MLFIILRDFLLVIIIFLLILFVIAVISRKSRHAKLRKNSQNSFMISINATLGFTQGISAQRCYNMNLDGSNIVGNVHWLPTVGITFIFNRKSEIITLDSIVDNLPIQQCTSNRSDRNDRMMSLRNVDDTPWKLEFKLINPNFSFSMGYRNQQFTTLTQEQESPGPMDVKKFR
jgi:hypothetical protein